MNRYHWCRSSASATGGSPCSVTTSLRNRRRCIAATLEDQPQACGFQNSAAGLDLGLLCGTLIFVEEAAEDGPALDPLLGEVGDGVVGAGAPA